MSNENPVAAKPRIQVSDPSPIEIELSDGKMHRLEVDIFGLQQLEKVEIAKRFFPDGSFIPIYANPWEKETWNNIGPTLLAAWLRAALRHEQPPPSFEQASLLVPMGNQRKLVTALLEAFQKAHGVKIDVDLNQVQPGEERPSGRPTVSAPRA